MPAASYQSSYPFPPGGGDMGDLIRTHDWTSTPLGTPDTWPQSLRTTVGIVVNSTFPMMLFWGDRLTCFYNDAARSSLDTSDLPAALGRPAPDVWPEAWLKVGPLVYQVMTTGESVRFDDYFLPVYRNNQSGDAYWTFSCSPAYGDDGQISGVLATFTETTDRVQARRQSQTSEHYYRQLTDTVPAIIWETRPDGYCTYLNQPWYDLSGQTRAQAEGFGWLDATHPDDRAESGRLFMEANQAQVPFSILYRFRHKDGVYRWAIDRGRPRFGADGTFQGMVGTVVDIHDQKLAEDNLRASEERFEAAIAAVQGILWTNNANGEMAGEQPGWAALTGQTYADYLGYGWTSAVHPDDAQPTVAAWQEALDRRGPFVFEHRVRLKSGQYEPFSIQAIPLLNANGTIREWVGVHTNVTRQRQAEETLRQSRERQTFLLRLSDQLRVLTDPAEIQYRAACVLGEYVGADRVGYAEDQRDGQHVVVTRNYTNGVPGIEGRYQYSDYGTALMTELQAGRMVVRPDIVADSTLSETEKEAHALLQLGATANLPLMKTGRLTAILFLHYHHPHPFSDGELSLLSEVAERTWEAVERARVAEALRASEAKLRSLITAVPVAIGLFVGRDLIIDLPNQMFIDIAGKGPDIVGKPLREVMPELITENQPFLQILDDVYTTGQLFQSFSMLGQVMRQGVLTTGYYDFTYSPLYDEAGEVYAILEVAVDVTEQVLDRRKIEESEEQLRQLVAHSPVAVGLVTGRELIIERANDSILAIWGKDRSVIGKPLAEALPELVGQPFLPLLDEVYTTGRAYHTDNDRAELELNGVLRTYYLAFSYTPIRNAGGNVYAILITATDVTGMVLARQQIEEAEASLRGAVELAQLGTWSITVATNTLTYSDRLVDWFGYDPQNRESYSRLIPTVQDEDRDRVEQATAWALNPASDGIFDEVYTIIHPQTGQRRILHAQGKTVFDASGKAVRMNGTAQDITIQRELQLALENEVQQRTRQLQDLIGDLERSNTNLQQFAYVASHDLQEPLRKIQSFGDMLHRQYSAQLGDTGTDFLIRMQTAASRMSTLIRDLLAYSRISTQPESSQPVALDTVLDTVLSDLDLVIHETGAVVTLEPLPTVVGDQLQLTQLFGNLLTNALKFRRSGVAPVIGVRYRLVAAADLPPAVRPTRKADTYHAIEVADNGIGFDEKYVDRIFQVFQRLHGKNEFAGTGIGLAICEKVIANHGGVITASSQPGQGATFGVYLPAQIS